MNKLLSDLLKSPRTKKYSRKSVITFVTFIFILLLGTFIVVSDGILKREINQYSIDVFNSLLVFLAVLLGLNITDKKILNKNDTTEIDQTENN